MAAQGLIQASHCSFVHEVLVLLLLVPRIAHLDTTATTTNLPTACRACMSCSSPSMQCPLSHVVCRS